MGGEPRGAGCLSSAFGRMTRALVHICPYCGKRQDLTSQVVHRKDLAPGAKEATPTHGDISFCITCGRVSRFAPAKRGGMRRLSLAEEDEFAKHPMVQKIYAAWLISQAQMKGPGGHG